MHSKTCLDFSGGTLSHGAWKYGENRENQMQTYISKANYLSLIDESSSIVRQVSEFLVFKR